MINFGVLGCANIAKKCVIPAIIKSEYAIAYAIAGRNIDKTNNFKQEFGFEAAYGSYEELLSDKNIQAVYIPLPNSLHYEWVIKALKAGKHVLCEKPLGLNEKQAKDMFEVAEQTGCLLMEAFASRQNPVNIAMKDIIEKDTIGKIKVIQSDFAYMIEGENNVRLDKSLGGGATYDVGCYSINLIRFLFGKEPTDIKAFGEISKEQDIDISSTVIMKFDDECIGISKCGFNRFRTMECVIKGEYGCVSFAKTFNQNGRLELIVETNNSIQTLFYDVEDNYKLEIDNFSNAIEGKQDLLITKNDTLGNAKVIDEVLKQLF